MKQLYSVGPLAGLSAASDGPYAPAVSALPACKAASRGLRPEDVQSALPYTGYALPQTWSGESTGPLPVRLALLQTASAGRILTHVAPNGGTYFAHALLNVPSTADAQLAIRTWGSPRWQRHDPDTAGDLPELPYLPVADLLDDESLRNWLDEPARRTMVEFVIGALLTTPAETRIVVAAPADDVARIVYAVTRALPHGLLEGFTFSTYESDARAAAIRLVGHDTGRPERDLPEGCYTSGSVAFNLHTGRKSDLGADVPFAAFAVAALAGGETAHLDELQTTWQLLGLTDARQFDLVYRLSRGSAVLTKDEAVAAVGSPTLAAWIAARPDAVSQFVAWALDDTEFAHRALSRLVAPLRQKTDAIARVATEVRRAGLAAVASGDRTRAANALEVILPMVAPAKANAVWGDLLEHVPEPKALAWDMRRYLLPRLVRFKHPNAPAAAVDPALAKWLEVPADHLQDLLTLELPKPYQFAAAQACLVQDGEPTTLFAHAVATQPAVVLELLKGAGSSSDRAAMLFTVLLTEIPSRPWFEDVLAQADAYSAPARNRLFEVALSVGTIDPDRVIRSQGAALLSLFSGGSGLDRLGRLFLTNPPADVFTNRTLLDFLGKLKDEPQVGADVKDRISAVQVVRQFLDAPEFTAETLQPVAGALAAQPAILPASAGTQVLEGVSTELSRRSESNEFQRDLELVLLHLGSVLAENPAGLYRELLRRQRTRREFGVSTKSARAFLAVALGAAQSEDVARQTEGLEAEAFAIATDAARRGGRRAIREIEAHSQGWPKSARTQWGFLVEAVRPKEIGRSLRELCLFAAGAGAATVVWFVVAYFTR
ncbi:GAP1-N2 domain-containing protein [Frigoriglobus tundricola]|uniref:Uncharacterized protein n=1 Tax=Frigoriglobus tundricola TaxID=2774151 RepID=A0A6M5Z4D3_9BACT|nr:hypothetical protein [Frigoriglobus tundricola]QJX00575.1 hypothetical protein FTUN_8207 [Frigoriglobus tundricola]